MKTKYVLLIATTAVISASAVRADEAVVVEPARPVAVVEPDRGPFYPSNQVEVDLFGTYATRDREGDHGDHFGGGIGVNYFLTRHFGIGADTYLEEAKWPYRVNGSAILRLPIHETGLAIYGFGGGGREFKDVPQYTGHAGGGAEFRLCSHAGIFGDIRRVFTDKTPDYTLIRTGVSIGF